MVLMYAFGGDGGGLRAESKEGPRVKYYHEGFQGCSEVRQQVMDGT